MIEATNWSKVTLYNWSLMPNHFHFLLQTPDGNVSEFMQRLLTRYAKYFNWVHKKVGHVFQGRYCARVCDKEQYFLELVRYVELNPYRLKKGKLAELGKWKWSSLRYYLGKEEVPEGLRGAMDQVLDRFGKTLEEARRGLAQFLAEGLQSGTWEDFYKPKGHRYLGDDSFVERVKQASGEPVRIQKRKLIRMLTIEELGAKVRLMGGPSSEELAGSCRKSEFNRWRKALVYVGRVYYRFSVQGMGTYLKRDGTAVSQILSRLKEHTETLPEIQKLLDSIQEKEVGA